jgi:hypothetical protein
MATTMKKNYRGYNVVILNRVIQALEDGGGWRN